MHNKTYPCKMRWEERLVFDNVSKSRLQAEIDGEVGKSFWNLKKRNISQDNDKIKSQFTDRRMPFSDKSIRRLFCAHSSSHSNIAF